MPSNRAAWLTEAKANPLVVKEAPYTSAGKDEVVVKNGAVAINPVDYMMQDQGYFIQAYPTILGCDVSGEIVEVGEGVKNFTVGDRVIGHCSGLAIGPNSHNGFQEYTVLSTVLTSKIPSSLPYTSAVVLPLGLSTAAAGLFQADYLALQHPSASPQSVEHKAILIWGGASSVGSCAIQLAKASGYQVYATASSHNFSYCKELGASEVFDYKDVNVVTNVVNALKRSGFTLAGAYDAAAKEDTIKACCEILAQSGGQKILASVLPGTDSFAASGVKVVPVFAPSIAQNEVGPAVYRDFLPGALDNGSFLAKPDAKIVGKGLDKVQEGITKLKSGASAQKFVIEL